MPKFSPTITLGNLLALLTFVLAAVGAVVTVSNVVAAQAIQIAVNTTRVDAIETAYKSKDIDLSVQMNEMKIEVKGVVKDLGDDVKAELREIKRRLK